MTLDSSQAAALPPVPGPLSPGEDSDSPTWRWASSAPGSLRLFLVTFLAYAVGSRLALLLIDLSGLQSVFFIPAGITVAFLLRLPLRSWWVVVAAAGAAEGTMDLLAGYSVPATAGFMAANMVEPVIGASIVRRTCRSLDLSRLRHVGWFLLGAVVIGPAVGAAVGSIPAAVVDGGQPLTQFGQWWLGDALGVILVGGVILVWGPTPDRRSLASLPGLGLMAGTLALTLVDLTVTELPLLFLVLIGVTVAGALFGSRAVAVNAFIVAATIAVGLAADPSEAAPNLASSLVLVKLQLALFAAAGLVVAAEANEVELASRAAIEASAEARIAQAERTLERRIAERLQQAFLPKVSMTHPAVDVASTYMAGSDEMVVGGDWYEVIDLSEGRLGLIIGDVAGHGLEAAVAMGDLRTASAAFALREVNPAALLSQLDEYIAMWGTTDFATVSYAVLDLVQGGLTYASAGHPPLLLVTPDGGSEWLMEGRARPLLGRVTDGRSNGMARLSPGSTLIGYTDGLIERRDSDLTDRMKHLASQAVALAHLSPSEMCDRLIAALGVGDVRDDDVVLVVLRYQPPPSDK